MQSFDLTFTLPLALWILLGAALLITAGLALWGWHRAGRLSGWQAAHLPDVTVENAAVSEWPGVSVVVYVGAGDVSWLDDHLPLLLSQDYPDFDIILVADGCDDEGRYSLSKMLPQSPLLRLSFVPEGTRSLSRRKLSLMLGVKASQKEVVLTTNANCRPVSDQWLKLMMRHFVQESGIELVLGYCHPRWRDDKRPGRSYRAYDWLVVSAQWLSGAVGGKPYRGVGQNLAFRRSLFFRHNGYAGSMDLNRGDDDVWVSEVASSSNATVELSPESFVTLCSRDAKRGHADAKLHRDFTTRFVPTRAPRLAEGVASTANYVRLALLAGAVAVGWRYALADGLALLLIIGSWLLSINCCRHLSRTLAGPHLGLTVPLLRLWRPVINVVYRFRALSFRRSNYTSIYN